VSTPEAVTSNTVTSYQVRAELEDLLERDLHGPWGGIREELPRGTSPACRAVHARATGAPGEYAFPSDQML
jgi:hypothetical protein